MCECIVQQVSSKDCLAYFAQREPHGVTNAAVERLRGAATFRSQDRQSVIKPSMQVSAIRSRGGHLECIKVRWGWSPIWSVGTMPPLTHLPLHLVMRSKVFDEIKREGRVLVAVDGWYESTDAAMTTTQKSLTYTTSCQSSPIFLAALAQASETHTGCDGLTLMTIGDIASKQQRVLAFNGEDALQWLKPDLDWQQAWQMAAQVAVAQPQVEQLLTARRLIQGGR